MTDNWKTVAIVFIVLFVLAVASLVMLVALGQQATEKENECAYEVCEDYESYYYDYIDKECYCVEDGIVEHQENLG